METKTIDLDGFTATVSRMTPLTRTEQLAIVAAGAHDGEQGHEDANDFWKNVRLHRFFQNVVMPETVQELKTPKGETYQKKAGKPCVSAEPVDGRFYLGDIGFSRFWALASEISAYTGEPEATFRCGDAAAGEDSGADMASGEVDGQVAFRAAD